MATAAVVSVSMGVMKPILAKLATLMGDKYKKIKRLRKMVAFLQRELGDMDALLEKMDSADELDPQAKKWRRDIIEMSYNIEDRVDDFMHSIGEADGKIGILRKAANYLRTFKDRRRLANDFQEMKALVIEASSRRKRYMLDQCISVSTPAVIDPRMSALYKESASLVGIDSQKDELVNWAMDEGKQLKFMAIVGFGGIGKTTLANEVYREVGGKFECKAFISVSQKPQMIELYNSLLSQLGQQPYSHACQLQDPINALRGHLQDKRYLIVVDDLWDMQAWDAIQCAFPQSNHSSRVIITTRNENVAARSCCHDNGQIHNMKCLSEQDSRKLFFDRIFGSEDACPTELKKPSCEVLKKCDGLPLAIITMASMLAYQPREVEAWEYILKSLGTKSAPNSTYEDMIYILDLSYKNLPHHLKACFLYLGSYPEDYEINKDELVRRWVAEGFVSNCDGKHDVWDVAESYFNELVNRSMIQPTYMTLTYLITDDVVSGCRVHDMLLELIVRRCKEDNFLSLVNDVEDLVEAQDRVIRRLTVAIPRDEEESIWDTSIIVRTNISQVRSLAILGIANWIPPLKFKYIRVVILKIMTMREIDLTCINQLTMLRYFEVDAYCVVSLPAQIQGLPYLETLDLIGKPIHLNSKIFGKPIEFRCRSTIPTDIIDVPPLSRLSMPAQIQGPCLETLDLSKEPIGFGSISTFLTEIMDMVETSDLPEVPNRLGTFLTEIIDVPRLSHLAMPAQRMWYMTGKMKSLRTLHGFCAPPDSSESIVGLGELTNLVDLEFYFPDRWALLEKKTECMAALSASFEKLCNLKRLTVATVTHGLQGIAWCIDELSSLSPAFRNLEHLKMRGCTFSRIPKWIGHLQKLRVLHLGAKQIFQEDVAIIGRGSSSLIILSLRITSIPTERIVIGGSTGFPLVKLFDFDCDGISYLTFEQGAMPELRKLSFVLDTDKWDKAAPGGLQHLPSLEKIEAFWLDYNLYALSHPTESEEKKRAVTAVFQEALGGLLTRPPFISSSSLPFMRPMQEDDYLMKHGVEQKLCWRQACSVSRALLLLMNDTCHRAASDGTFPHPAN